LAIPAEPGPPFKFTHLRDNRQSAVPATRVTRTDHPDLRVSADERRSPDEMRRVRRSASDRSTAH